MRRTGLRPRRLAPLSLRGASRGRVALAGPPPGNFLTDVFPRARQSVWAAFGADLSADPSTWSWVDITRYCLWDIGVNARIANQGDAVGLQTAEFTVKLRNDQAAPSGPGWFLVGNVLSPFWPDVKIGTPIWAQLDIGNGPSTRFYGYATSWKPTRAAGGRDNTVTLTANGVGQRLRQGGKGAVRSAMWRFHMLSYRYPTNTNTGYPDAEQRYHALPTHYWTLAESSGAVQGSNEIDPDLPLVADGASRVPQFGSDNYLPGPGSMTRFNDGSSLSVSFPSLIRTNGAIEVDDVAAVRGLRVQTLLRLDESAQTALSSALGTLVDGLTCRVLTLKLSIPGLDAQNFVVYLDHDATDGLLLYADTLDSRGVSITGVAMGGAVGLPFDKGVYLTADLMQDAVGGVSMRFGVVSLTVDPLSALPENSVVAIYDIQALPAGTPAGVGISGLSLAEFANGGGMSLGQVSVYSVDDYAYPDRYPHALLGRSGDTVAERLERLGIENNVHIEVVGTPGDIIMGPMKPAAFLDLVQECAAVDQGLLFDGLGPGLTYVSRTEAYGRPPDITFNAGNGDEIGADEPDHNNATNVNIYTATSTTGGTQTFTQTDGEGGADDIGEYDSGGAHPAAFDGDLYQIAAWRVALGMADTGLRYQKFRFNLAKPVTSTRAQQWLEMLPMRRFDVLNTQPGLPDPDSHLLLRGWTEHWNSKVFEVTSNTAPYAPWNVASLAADTGDASDALGWLDIDGSTVSGSAAATDVLYETFESGVSAWAAQNSWTFAQDSTFVRNGSWSVKLTPPGATASGGIITSAYLPAVPGVSYLIECWFYSVAGWSDCRAALDWYDGAGNFITSSLGSATVVPAGVWTVSRQTFTAPAGAARRFSRARQGGTPAATDVVWVDDLVSMPLLQLVTPSGPVWVHDAVSTYADDITGLYLNMDGMRVGVLGITGATSPQTLIINPSGLLRVLPTGAAVTVWDPVRVGL